MLVLGCKDLVNISVLIFIVFNHLLLAGRNSLEKSSSSTLGKKIVMYYGYIFHGLITSVPVTNTNSARSKVSEIIGSIFYRLTQDRCSKADCVSSVTFQEFHGGDRCMVSSV